MPSFSIPASAQSFTQSCLWSTCRRSLLLPALTAAAFVWLGGESRATVMLFDNLSAGSPNGSFGVTNTQWAAQAFSTTATDFTLSAVSLRLWNQNATSGNFEIQVWDSTGSSGTPGAQVGSAIYTGLAQNLSDSDGSLLSIPGLSVALSATTTYYLVARGTTLTGAPENPGTLYWDATDVNTTASYDTTDGTTWFGPYSQNLFMSVAAVPEPASVTLLGIGLAAVSVSAWLRRGTTRLR